METYMSFKIWMLNVSVNCSVLNGSGAVFNFSFYVRKED